MTRIVRRHWQADIGSGLPRRDCRSCTYDAYIPDRLVGCPLTFDADVAADVAELLGRSFEATNIAIQRLIDAEILQQVRVGRRNRAFEAFDVITVFTDLERQLASTEGNTRVSPRCQRHVRSAG